MSIGIRANLSMKTSRISRWMVLMNPTTTSQRPAKVFSTMGKIAKQCVPVGAGQAFRALFLRITPLPRAFPLSIGRESSWVAGISQLSVYGVN
ncbi:hypothetical protein D3C84_948750 [compost metagenome]